MHRLFESMPVELDDTSLLKVTVLNHLSHIAREGLGIPKLVHTLLLLDSKYS